MTVILEEIMHGYINQRVIGATLIGLALVFGAYVINNFGDVGKPPTTSSVAGLNAGIERVAIATQDTDQNGIEDWRDEFVTASPVFIKHEDTPYTTPDTLTGQMSISFFQNLLTARTQGPFGRSNEQIINDTVNNLGQATETKLYDAPDITIMKTWDDVDIVNYANTIAGILYERSTHSKDGELTILNDILNNGAKDRMVELEKIAEAYKNYRDDTLATPVPAFLAKQHLDLINTYQAIYEDISAMVVVETDPALSLLRIKRYQDDADGLAYALQNMYKALEPHASLFTVEDPAAIFILFSPNYKS